MKKLEKPKENNFDFYWDARNETYSATLKLEDNIARIYFTRNFGSIKKDNYLGWVWNVGLAIGKRKDINKWYYGTAPTQLNNLPTFNRYGVKVLIWAKKAVENFMEEKSYGKNAIAVGAADKRRERTYKYLKRIGFRERTVKYGYNYDFHYDYDEEDFYYENQLVCILSNE